MLETQTTAPKQTQVTNSLGALVLREWAVLIRVDRFRATPVDDVIRYHNRIIPAVIKYQLGRPRTKALRWAGNPADRKLLSRFLADRLDLSGVRYIRMGPHTENVKPFKPSRGLLRRGEKALKIITESLGERSLGEQVILKMASRKLETPVLSISKSADLQLPL